MPKPHSSKSPSVRALEAAARPCGLDRFGAVESGYLNISGLTLRIGFVLEHHHSERFIGDRCRRFP
jgi:hypothetical protein